MPDFCDASATNDNGSQGANFTAGGCELFANQSREAGDSVRETEALWDSRHSPPDTGTAGRTSRSSRTACPPHIPSGRFSLIALRTALSAARRSAGSAARYWATVGAVMLATIPPTVRWRELYGGRL